MAAFLLTEIPSHELMAQVNPIEKIRLIICPDQRKWSRSGPIYKPREDPANFDLIRAMISEGFLVGDTDGAMPAIKSLTWKANDLYMATQKEGVRIRLMARFHAGLEIGVLHELALALHSEFGDRWNRRGR
jgi:hypothetical protein